MNESTYFLTSDGELYHYGVIGMKWGVRRAHKKASRNIDLGRKALKYDKKSAVYTKKSEKAHADKDLELSNRAAKKAAKYTKKAATVREKALEGSDTERLRAEQKATKLEYKAAKKKPRPIACPNRLATELGR